LERVPDPFAVVVESFACPRAPVPEVPVDPDDLVEERVPDLEVEEAPLALDPFVLDPLVEEPFVVGDLDWVTLVAIVINYWLRRLSRQPLP